MQGSRFRSLMAAKGWRARGPASSAWVLPDCAGKQKCLVASRVRHHPLTSPFTSVTVSLLARVQTPRAPCAILHISLLKTAPEKRQPVVGSWVSSGRVHRCIQHRTVQESPMPVCFNLWLRQRPTDRNQMTCFSLSILHLHSTHADPS